MTDDFFRARLDGMIDPSHALAVLAQRLPWARIEQAIAPCFARKVRPEQLLVDDDLFGNHCAVGQRRQQCGPCAPAPAPDDCAHALEEQL